LKFEYQGKEYVLRPTFGAIADIENKLDCGFINLVEKIAEKGILVNEQQTIWYYGLKYGGNQLSMQEIKEIFNCLGMVKITTISCQFIKLIIMAK
jgi:hypothetical protein